MRGANYEQKDGPPGEDRDLWIVVREGTEQQGSEGGPKARVGWIALTIGVPPTGVVERRHILRKEAVTSGQRDCVCEDGTADRVA